MELSGAVKNNGTVPNNESNSPIGETRLGLHRHCWGRNEVKDSRYPPKCSPVGSHRKVLRSADGTGIIIVCGRPRLVSQSRHILSDMRLLHRKVLSI